MQNGDTQGPSVPILINLSIKDNIKKQSIAKPDTVIIKLFPDTIFNLAKAFKNSF